MKVIIILTSYSIQKQPINSKNDDHDNDNDNDNNNNAKFFDSSNKLIFVKNDDSMLFSEYYE